MLVLIVAGSVGLCVAAIVGFVATLMRGDEASIAEDRLATLTAQGRMGDVRGQEEVSALRNPLVSSTNFLEEWMDRKFNIKVMLEQADVKLPPSKFSILCVGLALAGTVFEGI